MAYSSIDVQSMKNSIQNCNNSINYRKELQILNSISDNSVWNGSAKQNLINAMEFLFNTKMKKLDTAYNNLEYVTHRIATYQEYKRTYDSIKSQYDSLPNTRETVAQKQYLRKMMNEYKQNMNSVNADIRNTCSNIISMLN